MGKQECYDKWMSSMVWLTTLTSTDEREPIHYTKENLQREEKTNVILKPQNNTMVSRL